ncbi:MAG: hypothetical protein HXY50_08990 [Ignavibacteriaceae bacterium]|nr:hypothetical protein [Ignavibacteriaceae bacterium]
MKRFNSTLSLILAIAVNIWPCTTAVISGKATDDGRPLLLKNRDSDALQNKLVYFSQGKFKFIGLVNSADKENKEVWCGFNSAGFGIMNSASYNLKGNDTTKLSDQEGKLMKLALESCATLEDFETMLESLPKPLGVEANFGVIDAIGGAAYYETSNYKFVKYDVNDPNVAPDGYLIRTNYSFSGEENKGYGYIRYKTAASLLADKFNNGKISSEFLINDVPRCLIHSFTGTDLTKVLPKSEKDNNYVFFRDYIPRYLTSAAVVIQGIKKDEKVNLTTMWTILGFPLSSVIIPLWLIDDGALPEIMQANESNFAPLCDLALKLKDRAFSFQNDARENYLNVAALFNQENTGVYQKLAAVEKKILYEVNTRLTKWRETELVGNEVKEFYAWIDSFVINEIKKQFDIN